MTRKSKSQADEFETYRAIADAEVARAVAATESPFSVEIRFLGGLTDRQKAAFRTAADRWTRVIVGDLPAVTVDGEVIDDILILAQGAEIDGPGRVLGQAGPTHLRPGNAGTAAFLPAKGIMTFDSSDLAQMEQNGTLNDVIAHEMGHVLGSGTIWTRKGLLRAGGSPNPTFVGVRASAEYGRMRGGSGVSTPVPVENTGGEGTRDSHWRESIFRNELMSGFISAPGNPLSRLTVASLLDLGYAVDMDAAESYALPNLLSLAESGFLVSHGAPIDEGIMLMNIPMVLPEASLA